MIKLIKTAMLGALLASPMALASASAADLVQKAESAYKAVASETGYQWLTTTRALKAAKKALDAGNADEAIKQANFALDLVEATQLQAEIESKAWQARVPK